ncbi:MAG TPA: phosphatidate cytidylyltransferase [Bacteroidaceae bacterium]|nr:phosphatidate cytidylyltransferase [Bacteroidaceae bacterium]
MELLKRSITGVLFVILVIFCLLSGQFWFAGLFAIIVMLTLKEYVLLINRLQNVYLSSIWVPFSGLLLFLAFFIYNSGLSNSTVFAPFLLSLIYLFVRELFLKSNNPITNLALSVLGLVYVAFPFSLLTTLAFNIDKVCGPNSYSYLIPITLFIIIWCNDIGAYCVGRTIGKHKLFEHISPNKTWEGSIGGAIFSIAASLILSLSIPNVYGHLPIWAWIGMAVVIVVFGTLGDLVESLLKRSLKIKDSGKILPGHGGLLDRFDSTLIAIPATTVYLMILSFFF